MPPESRGSPTTRRAAPPGAHRGRGRQIGGRGASRAVSTSPFTILATIPVRPRVQFLDALRRLPGVVGTSCSTTSLPVADADGRGGHGHPRCDGSVEHGVVGRPPRPQGVLDKRLPPLWRRARTFRSPVRCWRGHADRALALRDRPGQLVGLRRPALPRPASAWGVAAARRGRAARRARQRGPSRQLLEALVGCAGASGRTAPPRRELPGSISTPPRSGWTGREESSAWAMSRSDGCGSSWPRVTSTSTCGRRRWGRRLDLGRSRSASRSSSRTPAGFRSLPGEVALKVGGRRRRGGRALCGTSPSRRAPRCARGDGRCRTRARGRGARRVPRRRATRRLCLSASRAAGRVGGRPA